MNKLGIWLLVAGILLIAGGWYARTAYTKTFASHYAHLTSEHIEADLRTLDAEADRILQDGASPESSAWDNATHPFFLSRQGRVITWNENDYIPDLGTTYRGELRVLQSTRGTYLVKGWRLDSVTMLTGIIPLVTKYPITNAFLVPAQTRLLPTREVVLIGTETTFGEAVKVNDVPLFKIVASTAEWRDNFLSAFLLFGGFVVAMCGVWWLVVHWNFFDGAFLILLVTTWAARQEMQRLGVPSVFSQSDLFDPKKFASSALNSSMGDLLLNAVCLLLLAAYVFRYFSKFRLRIWMVSQAGIARWLSGLFCLLLCYFAILLPFNFVEVIYHNSTVSLDITQSISFDAVRLAAYGAVAIAGFSSFLLFHVFVRAASKLLDGSWLAYSLAVIVAGLLFLGQAVWSGQDHTLTLGLCLVLLLAIRLYPLPEGLQFSGSLFYYLTSALLVFSLQTAGAVRQFAHERLVQMQARYARGFLAERDILGEYLLDQARAHIQQDPFIKARMAGPVYGTQAVADKVKRFHLSRYFDRYETTIDVQPAEAYDSTVTNFRSTGYPGIYYSLATDDSEFGMYRAIIPLRSQRPIGAVIITLSLKRIIPNSVYPELLVDNRFKEVYRTGDLSYAVYKDRFVRTRFGNFNYTGNFANMLENRSIYDEGVSYMGYYHVAVEGTDGSVAVVSAPTTGWFYFLAELSFWFALGLGIILIYQGILGWRQWTHGARFNYAARIQLFIFLAFLIPVVAVSVTTLTLMGRSSEESIKEDFQSRAEAIGSGLAEILKAGADDSEDLGAYIEEHAASGKIDISVFHPDGRLWTTTQPALFSNELISPYMNRAATRELIYGEQLRTVTSEQIGNLQYSCAYASVNSADGVRLAIVALPFFESASYVEKSQGLILANILIVFLVVFFLFSLVSFWVSGSLASPIRIISQALSRTTLTGQNRRIEWDSTDEIGQLVKQYNLMVSNLEQSLQALARSEKESAWREMARQVAHEIKNPLTPMKLTLQQLEQGQDMPPEKVKKSVEMLLHQVEILNQIAASFSSFASMPAPDAKQINLTSVLSETVRLFEAQTDGTVTLEAGHGDITVMADPKALSRVFSNIIINSLQARKDGHPVMVKVGVRKMDNRAIVSIADTGRGMTDTVKSKVFQPQFTTKQSGSGLGLAMARQIIQQAGGKVWFETTEGVGTTFFVELPVV